MLIKGRIKISDKGRIPIYRTCLIYILLGFLLTRFSLPEIIKSFISLPSFLIIPIIIGDVITSLFLRRLIPKEFNLLSKTIVKWFLGVTTLTVMSISLQYVNVFWIFLPIFALAILTFSILLLLSVKVREEYIIFQNFSACILTFIIIISISILPVLISSLFLPFPFFGLNHDQPRLLIQPVLRVIEGSYLMLDVRIPEVILTALICLIFNIDPSSFGWSVRFLLGILFDIGLFLLILEITKRKSLALLSTLIGTFAFSGGAKPYTLSSFLFMGIPAQSFKSTTILFSIFPWILLLIEMNFEKNFSKIGVSHLCLLLLFASLLFTYFMIAVDRMFGFPHYCYRHMFIDPIVILMLYLLGILMPNFLVKEEKRGFLIVYLIIFTFSLFHSYEGYLFSLVLLGYLLLTRFEYKKHPYNLVRYLAILSISLVIFYQIIYSLGINLFAPLESLVKLFIPLTASYADTYNKIKCLIDGNSIIIPPLFIFGSVMVLRTRHTKFVALAWFLLFLYLSPLPWTYRVFRELIIFLAYLASFPLFLLLQSTQKLSINIQKGSITVIMILLLILLPQPVYERFSWNSTEYFPRKGIQSPITLEEWEAAFWMRKNLPKNSILISDSFTMWILTPLANKVWAVEPTMDPPLEVPKLFKQLYYIKNYIFRSRNSVEAFNAIKNITPFFADKFYVKSTNEEKNYSYIIVVSKRTVWWTKIDAYGFTWNWPSNLDKETWQLYELFQDKRYFELVYENNFLRVYFVKC